MFTDARDDGAVTAAPDIIASRRIVLDGPANLRDLGGYRARERTVRKGLVFRSDGLDTVSDRDLDVLVHDLGITTVIDLRTQDELAGRGSNPMAALGVVVHHVPIIDRLQQIFSSTGAADFSITQLYQVMVTDSGPRFAAALQLLAHAPSPILFHCAAGKDRTGILAALLLALLTVTDDDIASDYAQSAAIAGILRERMRARAADPRYRELAASVGDMQTLADEMLSARPETIIGVLDQVRSTHGTVSAWARSHGLGDDDIDRLRGRFLTEPAGSER
jgi:protein-tyrosine phosphatase